MDNNPNEKPEPSRLTGAGPERVLQPLTPSLPESAATQPVPAPPVQSQLGQTALTSPPQNPTPNVAPTPSQPTVSSIYPTATKGIGINDHPPVPTQPVPNTESSSVDANIARKILIVRIVTGFFLFVDGVSLINAIIEATQGYVNFIFFAEACIITALFVGIFMLKESARLAYVFLTLFLLIVSAIYIIRIIPGEIAVDKANKEASSQSQTLSIPEQRAMLKQALANSYNNKEMTPAQRQVYDQDIQKQINNLSGSPTELKIKQYLGTSLTIFLAIFPLIFYTRPTIKSVFE